MDVGKIREASSSLHLSGDASEGTPITAHLFCFPQKSSKCVIALLCFWAWPEGSVQHKEEVALDSRKRVRQHQHRLAKGERRIYKREEIDRQDGTAKNTTPHFLSLLLRTTSQIQPMQMNLKCCYNTPASGWSKWGYRVAQVWLCVLMTVLFKKGGEERNKVSLYGRRQMPWVIVYIGIQLTDHKSRSICQQTKLLLSSPLCVSLSFFLSLLYLSLVCFSRTFSLPFTNYIRLF